MRRYIFALCAAVIFSGFSGAPVAPDPMVITEPTGGSVTGVPFLQTSSAANLLITINPAQKTLVLMVAGQSIWTNVTPTLYTPTNSSVISQLNLYDGAFYSITSDVLGSGVYQGSFGPGNISVRLADLLVTNGSFNNVILVNFAIGGTSIAQWASPQLTNRVKVAMLRLAAQGITPSTTGVTFGLLFGQGETDNSPLGTSQSAYAASLATFTSAVFATGFSGRIFICEETWINGTTSSGVEAAQVAAVNNTTIFSGGNLDSFGAADRQADNTHFNDTGAPLVATAVYNAMHASGSPY